jgi:hypothetical protein
MGLLSALITAPLAPIRGVVWLAERLEEVAADEQAKSRSLDLLRELQREHEAGLLTDEELAAAGAALRSSSPTHGKPGSEVEEE